MRRQDPDGAPHGSLLLRDIQGVLPGGKQTSSPDDAANLSEHLIAWNGIYVLGADFIPPTNRFRSPKAGYLVRVSEIEALNHSFRKERS